MSRLELQSIRERRSMGAAIVVDNLHVTYRVVEQRHQSLRQRFAEGFKSRHHRRIEALRGICCIIGRGEVVGIVGPNGSGKSTLMRSIAGLLPPTGGAVYASSRPMLLGVGAALKPKVSGRENIQIGCLALGFTRDEVAKHEQSIINFSGLEAFIDLPMRVYSSGMRARLHFSIATAVSPQILLLDEALAVGDRDFKRRSADRIREVRDSANIVVMVSHNLRQVQNLCTRALWIDSGQLRADGSPKDVIDAYRANDEAAEVAREEAERRST